jgi:hypothetical protein
VSVAIDFHISGAILKTYTCRILSLQISASFRRRAKRHISLERGDVALKRIRALFLILGLLKKKKKNENVVQIF